MQLRKVDTGFSTDGLWSISFDLRSSSFSAREIVALKTDLPAATEGIPGVRASAVSMLPLLFNAASITNSVAIDGRAPTRVPIDVVGPRYFSTLGVQVLSGREFSEHDNRQVEYRVIVNEAMAKSSWPGKNAIGQQVIIVQNRDHVPATVIGVVRDHVSDYVALGARPRLFKSALQHNVVSGYLYVRLTNGENIRPIRQAVGTLLARGGVVPVVLPVDQLREDSMAFLKGAFTVTMILSGLSLVLAATGIFAMLAYAVARRRREIGIRLALGSSRFELALLVVKDGLRAALAGLILGVPFVLVVTRLIRLLTLNAPVFDGVAFAVTAGVLLLLVLLASVLPIWNALRVDPLASLRSE
jgi:ABC-type antimicrobial peptide transport system permease subunit